MSKYDDRKTLLWRLYAEHCREYNQRKPDDSAMQFEIDKRDFAFEKWLADHPQYVEIDDIVLKKGRITGLDESIIMATLEAVKRLPGCAFWIYPDGVGRKYISIKKESASYWFMDWVGADRGPRFIGTMPALMREIKRAVKLMSI